MSNDLEHEVSIRELQGAVTVDFIKPVLDTYAKLQMVKADAKYNKTAKPYLETVEAQYRNQLKFLYETAKEAFPNDAINPNHALSSIGPEEILMDYDFKLTIMRKNDQSKN